MTVTIEVVRQNTPKVLVHGVTLPQLERDNSRIYLEWPGGTSRTELVAGDHVVITIEGDLGSHVPDEPPCEIEDWLRNEHEKP